MIVDQAARNPGTHCPYGTLEIAKGLGRRETNLPAATADQPVDDLENRPTGEPRAAALLQGAHGGVDGLASDPPSCRHLVDGGNEPVVGHCNRHLSPSDSKRQTTKATR